MNLSEAVSNIAKKLGNRTDLDDSIADELRLAQKELEAARTLPWFLLAEEQYIDLAGGTIRVALPTGFIREYEDGALWIYDSGEDSYFPLKKTHFDWLRDLTPSEIQESPDFYALAGQYFHLGPTYSDPIRLQILCYTAADTLTLPTDTNLWLTHNPELLLAKAGMRMAQYLRSTELFAMFQSQYVEAAGAQEHANVAREVENFEGFMGGS